MTSLPYSSSSLRSLPPRNGRGDSSTGLLGRSFPSRQGYSSMDDSREGSGSSLVPPVIDDSEVEGEGGDYMRRSSVESLGKRRARTAASALQGKDRELEMASDEDWFEIANPERRKDHLTRYTLASSFPPHSPSSPIATCRPSFTY